MKQIRTNINLFKDDKIFQIKNANEFNEIALEIFRYQYKNNRLYHDFVNTIGKKVEEVKNMEEIPFLPISFFKSHEIKSGEFNQEKVFLSSGTTKMVRSKHYIKSLALYEKSFLKAFNLFFGNPSDLVILCLLPSYQEQGDSSLLYMTDKLIKESNNPLSGYFLNEDEKLYQTISALEQNKTNYLLFGVSYALLDYIEKFNQKLSFGTIIETGGMKGRRKELTKEQLHEQLKKGFGTNQIASEYGMTELLSQAYSMENQVFVSPPWMKIFVRDTSDPFSILATNKTGLINVIDLANVYSCSFIATDDVGEVIADNQFKIKGRYDLADVRGCNLLVQ